MIGSLALAAAVGVFALLIDPDFSSTTARILGTTLTVTLFSLTALGCAVAWERDHWRRVAGVGFVISALSFIVFLPGIWLDMPRDWEEPVYKAMGHGATWSVYLALVCLLALARLKQRWRWTRYATQISATLLGLLISGLIVFEPNDDEWARALGVLAILTGCGTICVPILHKLSAMPPGEQLATTALILGITCPRCEQTQEVPAGRSRCGKCGLRFNIQIEEEACSGCGYPLYKLTSDRCPECGTPITAKAKH